MRCPVQCATSRNALTRSCERGETPKRLFYRRFACECVRVGIGVSLAEDPGMLIRAGYQIAIECSAETPLMALLSVHPTRQGDLRSPALISSSGSEPLVASIDE